MMSANETSKSNILEEQLAVGRPLLIGANTVNGHIQLNGNVSSLAGHHFKVKANKPVSASMFTPQQKLNVRLKGNSATLPMTVRFLRVNKKNNREIVLSLPDGEWITNRREFVRAQIGLDVVVLRSDDSFLPGTSKDISGGGISVELHKGELTYEERVTVLVRGSSEKGIGDMEFAATVVRVSDFKGEKSFGLRFDNINSREQNQVCKMVIVEQFERRRAELRDISGRSENQ